MIVDPALSTFVTTVLMKITTIVNFATTVLIFVTTVLSVSN